MSLKLRVYTAPFTNSNPIAPALAEPAPFNLMPTLPAAIVEVIQTVGSALIIPGAAV
jgi:hypothetical protein